jgi:hypothetical protein
MGKMAVSVPDVKVSPPHRVFSATLQDVMGGRVLTNALETSWRYFLVHGDSEPFAAAEVTGDDLSHVNEGPFVQGSANAMIAAEQLDATRQRDYELRLLRIPALYTVAIWLTSPDDDVLIPAEPAPEPLVANQSYDEAHFTDALRPLAELRLQSDDMTG